MASIGAVLLAYRGTRENRVCFMAGCPHWGLGCPPSPRATWPAVPAAAQRGGSIPRLPRAVPGCSARQNCHTAVQLVPLENSAYPSLPKQTPLLPHCQGLVAAARLPQESGAGVGTGGQQLLAKA